MYFTFVDLSATGWILEPEVRDFGIDGVGRMDGCERDLRDI